MSENTDETMTLTKAQVAQMIADAIAQVRPQTQPMDMAGLAKAIGESVAAGIAANTPPRKVSIGDYLRRGNTSPYHPKSNAETPRFRRMYSQNGFRIEHATTYDREIELLNSITHSGRYIDRLVEVVVAEDGSHETVDIRFNNKIDKVYELKGKAATFEIMLEQIVLAQSLERQEMEAQDSRATQRRQLSFGNKNKNVQDARSAAGVV